MVSFVLLEPEVDAGQRDPVGRVPARHGTDAAHGVDQRGPFDAPDSRHWVSQSGIVILGHGGQRSGVSTGRHGDHRISLRERHRLVGQGGDQRVDEPPGDDEPAGRVALDVDDGPGGSEFALRRDGQCPVGDIEDHAPEDRARRLRVEPASGVLDRGDECPGGCGE
jgi:hypothetical protein